MKKISPQKLILTFLEDIGDMNFPGGYTYSSMARSLHKQISKHQQLKEERLSELSVRQALYRVRKNGYIKIEKVNKKDGDHITFKVSRKGKKMLRNEDFRTMQLPKNTKWDGNWRFILFDIPEKQRYARDALRDKLKRLDCFQVQQSVWVYPFACKEEIDFLVEYFGLQKSVLFFEAPVENDERLREHYKKKKGIDIVFSRKV